MGELCFNLWYYLNSRQNITAIAARAYLLEGTDDEKASLLKQLSAHDHSLVKSTSLNDESDIHYSALEHLGVERIFDDEFERIRRELPEGLTIPYDKLFYATPLFDFGEGFVPAEICNGYIRNRA